MTRLKLPRQTRRIAAGLPPLPPLTTVRLSVKKPAIWQDLQAVQLGLDLVGYEQFKQIVLHTINCGDDYIAAKWSEFFSDRLGYCLSRDPEEQGYALVNLAVELARKKEQS